MRRLRSGNTTIMTAKLGLIILQILGRPENLIFFIFVFRYLNNKANTDAGQLGFQSDEFLCFFSALLPLSSQTTLEEATTGSNFCDHLVQLSLFCFEMLHKNYKVSSCRSVPNLTVVPLKFKF